MNCTGARACAGYLGGGYLKHLQLALAVAQGRFDGLGQSRAEFAQVIRFTVQGGLLHACLPCLKVSATLDSQVFPIRRR